MKIGVSFALPQGQLLAGEINRSAVLERTSPLDAGTSEAAAVADEVDGEQYIAVTAGWGLDAQGAQNGIDKIQGTQSGSSEG